MTIVGTKRKALLLLSTLMYLSTAVILASPAQAAQYCPFWEAQLWDKFFFGARPADPIATGFAWGQGRNPGNWSYTVGACTVSGAFPNQVAACDYTSICGPPNCNGNQTHFYPGGAGSWMQANPITCQPPLILDPDEPCLCKMPTLTLDPFKAAGACDLCKADPVDVSNGNVFEDQSDYVGTGPNPIRFVRRYNSLIARNRPAANPPGPFGIQSLGVGWTASYFQSLQIMAYTASGAASTVNAFRPSGQMRVFKLVGSVFVPDGDVADTLVTTPTGFQYQASDDTIETYGQYGELLGVSVRGSAPITVTADSTGKYPSKVTDSFGHSLTFSYAVNISGTPLLSMVTDPDGKNIAYAYDAQDNLTSVTYQDLVGPQMSYTTYTVPLLTQLKDENNVAVGNWAYAPDGNSATNAHSVGSIDNYTFSDSGGSVAVTDPLGKVRNYSKQLILGIYHYTSADAVCIGCGESKTRALDANGNVAARTDFNNNLTCYAYDTTRNLETVRVEGFAPVSTCPANLSTYSPTAGTRQRKITTTWNPMFRLPATIVEPNRTTVYAYYPTGSVQTRTVTDTSVTPNVSRAWNYTYDGYGRVLNADGPRTDVADTITYTYNTCTSGAGCGQVSTIQNAAGQITTYNTYNAHGLPLTITDPNGIVTTLTYDARQRLKTRQVGTETTTFDYYLTGLLQKVTLPDGSYVQYTYDPAHRLTKITDGLGNHVDYALDAMGNRTAESAYDPSSVLSRTRSRVFNTLNQLYQEVGSAGTGAVTTSYGYDSNGNQTTINAPLARNTTNQYDELNRLNQITDPGSGITQFGYDANDNLASVTDPRTLATNYTYTGFGDLKTQVSPDTGTTTNTYDSGGNLKTSTDGRGAISTYTYDTLNRVKTVAYKVGSTTDQTITYTYDAGTNGKGRLTGASDSGNSMSLGYDAQGRVTSKGQTIGTVTKTVGYTYTNGNMTTLTTPSGQSVVYSYTNGQVSQISVNGTTLLSNVVYEPLGPARGWTWGNGTTLSRLHNTDGLASQINSKEVMSFGYDNAFRLTSYNNTTVATASATYGYDLLDRLSSAGGNAGTYGWTYDTNGNRLTQTGSTLNLTISPTSNRMTGTTGARTTSYGYDGAGNTLTYSGNVFVYKNSGRMKTVTVAASTTTYLYNALGQRVKKSGGVAGTVLSMYDEAGHLLGEYNGTGGLVQETVWLGDIPVATLRPGTPAVIYYVHANNINTPVAVSRPSDNKFRWQWHPDAFGVGTPNENPQSLGAFKYNLRFPGQYYDQETGQHYNYFRDYDAVTGRYVESDPMGVDAGVNTYGYVGANPIGDSDPLGLDKLIQYVDNTALGHMGVTYPAIVYIYDTDTNQISGPYRGSTQPDQSRPACNGGCVSASAGAYKFKRGWFPNTLKKPGQQRYIALLLGTVPATGPNPNNSGNASLTGVWIHSGGQTSTTSEGCLTIDPSDWPSFIGNFGRGASGTVNLIR